MTADPAGMLIVLLLTFFGALGAGYLPYSIKVKESQLLVVSALGGGLLIGCALGIVIPEGFHAFSEIGGGEGHDHHDHDHDHDHGGHDHDEGPPAGLTGLALIAGFLLMMFLDQAQSAATGGHAHAHAHCGHTHHHHTHSHNASGEQDYNSSGDDQTAAHGSIELVHDTAAASAADPLLPDPTPSPGSSGKGGASPIDASAADRAVIGLLVHCVSDGLALGAAFLSGNATVSYGVGLALVLHKAPMAFGLTAYLQSCKWPWPRAQRTLVTFAATAPASAVATYTFLRAIPAFTTPLAVSLAILFSGGTFLHAAAMHILPEVAGEGGRFNGQQLAAVAVGCIVPVLFSWGHHH